MLEKCSRSVPNSNALCAQDRSTIAFTKDAVNAHHTLNTDSWSSVMNGVGDRNYAYLERQIPAQVHSFVSVANQWCGTSAKPEIYRSTDFRVFVSCFQDVCGHAFWARRSQVNSCRGTLSVRLPYSTSDHSGWIMTGRRQWTDGQWFFRSVGKVLGSPRK